MTQRAVDRTLALAERKFGLGRASGAPGWMRHRVLGVLESQAARHGVSLEAAADRIERDRTAVEELAGALRVGETRFYRDRAQWEAITARVIPSLPPGEVRALSAGCSTGEEAYTLAMALSLAGRAFRVLGVDRFPEAIAAAREGVYSADSARDLPAEWAARFCEPEGDTIRVGAELAAHVTFEELDLVRRTPRGPFHLIVFKNVLLYLAAPIGEAVVGRLVAELDEGGLLFGASSEVPRLRKAGLRAVRVAPSVSAFGRPAPPSRRGGGRGRR
jgi:chemotaxis protein methyltransferase CheR